MNTAKNQPDVVRVPGQDSYLYIPSESGKGALDPRDPRRARFSELEMLAKWLDSIFKIPGSNIRFGLDALLGLIPGLGDTVTSAASIYILLAAARNGVPRITIMRMAANIGLDYVVGCVPLLGDMFDVYWKANQKNVQLLERHAKADSAGVRKLQLQDWLFVGGLAFVLISILVGSVTIAYWLVGLVLQLFRGNAG